MRSKFRSDPNPRNHVTETRPLYVALYHRAQHDSRSGPRARGEDGPIARRPDGLAASGNEHAVVAWPAEILVRARATTPVLGFRRAEADTLRLAARLQACVGAKHAEHRDGDDEDAACDREDRLRERSDGLAVDDTKQDGLREMGSAELSGEKTLRRRTPRIIWPTAWRTENAPKSLPVTSSPRDCMMHRARLFAAGTSPAPKLLIAVAPTKRA